MIIQNSPPIFIGDSAFKWSEKDIKGEYISMLGEIYYKINNYDAIEPFFMSIVSSSNLWLFISSTGGLSAGRVSAEKALFPYYTVDKLTENSENTGNKAILFVSCENRIHLWEPFSVRFQGIYSIVRNIYKNVSGTSVVFEEINHSLGLIYRYSWRISDEFGFVKTTWLQNLRDKPCQIEFVDGLQNILPANVSMQTQNSLSTLLDAYKRCELLQECGLAIYSLNSTLTDLAEPSESLLATTVMQIGIEPESYLLSSTQLDNFRAKKHVEMETEVRGQRCAYFVHANIQLDAHAEKTWHLVADVYQDSAAIVRLQNKLIGNRKSFIQMLESDISANIRNLEKIVARADGFQISNLQIRSAFHFANVMFNVMRGGVFDDQYWVNKEDFIEFVSVHNQTVLNENSAFFSQLPQKINISSLKETCETTNVMDLIRLSYVYLPLSFSRRHGDPSRPWNRFAINIKKEDGSKQLDYEGNWRDIFQNWEPLAYSYPEYIENMICAFLNATTVDGYNPYRITRNGIDWELPEPDNPWSNIGYWSDHQIIYLQKLMEISSSLHPGKLETFLNKPMFCYADVPYRIKPYSELILDSHNTIDFDWELEREIEARVQKIGSDGKLVHQKNGSLLKATFGEKLITLLLAKLVNFIPEGGIWMNTQRPEWNDANNALVGKGVSVVTLCYLRRYVAFLKELAINNTNFEIQLSREVKELFSNINEIFLQYQDVLASSFTDNQRLEMVNALGLAGSNYRWNFYSNGFSGEQTQVPAAELISFFDLSQQFIEHSLRANKRFDNLYHAYNILHIYDARATISHLYEMLEGQVAILSSGMLSGEESLALLQSMRESRLYRADQHSYILYPDRNLKGFLEKNTLTSAQASGISLFNELVKAGDKSLIVLDENGRYHFNGTIRNKKDIARSLEALKKQSHYSELVKVEGEKIQILFEEIFHHDEFTGRSGTFFAYEGLGSIYWHMVSKLLLAVQETIFRTKSELSNSKLIEKYLDIREGQSFNKSPEAYGAFPTDPYSHTPKGQGAKQPGMTGLVKEEILARMTELGLIIKNGTIEFDFRLLDRSELLTTTMEFVYWNLENEQQQIKLEKGTLGYTICQVPIILRKSNERSIQIHFNDGRIQLIQNHILDTVNSKHIFNRDGMIKYLEVNLI